MIGLLLACLIRCLIVCLQIALFVVNSCRGQLTLWESAFLALSLWGQILPFQRKMMCCCN